MLGLVKKYNEMSAHRKPSEEVWTVLHFSAIGFQVIDAVDSWAQRHFPSCLVETFIELADWDAAVRLVLLPDVGCRQTVAASVHNLAISLLANLHISTTTLL